VSRTARVVEIQALLLNHEHKENLQTICLGYFFSDKNKEIFCFLKKGGEVVN